MCFGMFMAILDIQIVSASLSEIQAGLSASADEIPWVQTSYLIAEVIAIPLSGFLSRALGTRVLFTVSAAGFTLASIMCGLSSSIDSMIVWRALQGFIGGGMVPTVFASAYLIFPGSAAEIHRPDDRTDRDAGPDDRPHGRRLCYRRAVVALAVLHQHRAGHRRHGGDLRADRFRPARLFAAGAFRLVGPASAWPASSARSNTCWRKGRATNGSTTAPSRLLAVVSALSAVAFFVRVLTARVPIVDLRAFANRNFAVGSLFSFVLGIGLYGLTYLYPVYLAQIRGYDALMIGDTMFVSGLAMFLTAPIAGQLSQKFDPRFVLMAGFVLFAIGTWQMTYVTKDWDFWELLWPQIFRGIGLMFAIVPVTNTALGTLAPERVKNASGLFNLMRNLGGAIGLAAINTVLNDRMDLHLARLHEQVNWAREPATETLARLAVAFPGLRRAADGAQTDDGHGRASRRR